MLEKALRLKGWASVLSKQDSDESVSEETQKVGELQVTKLPYKGDDLQDILSTDTLDEHLKIHKRYVDNTREMVQGTKYADMELDDAVRILAKKDRDSRLFRNAAQAWNHAFYWMSISPPGQDTAPKGSLLSAVDNTFGGMDECREEMIHSASSVFGSGWVWLIVADGKLQLLTTRNEGTPLAKESYKPLLCLDIWEHAYFLDYRSDRKSYIDSAVKQLLNWGFAEKNFEDQTGW